MTHIAKEENNILEDQTIGKVEEEKNEIQILLQTDSTQEKTTPKTKLVLKKTYKECNHTINEYAQIPEEMVNKTKKEIQAEYTEWEIEKFNIEQIELKKEVEGVCNQHYILRPKNGIVVIYKIDQEGKEIEQEETAIATEYLTEEDLEKLEKGITIYGEEKLNAIIEDFE